MNTKQFLSIALFVASSLLLSIAIAAPLREGERIVRDPVTGDYTAYYWDEDEQDAEMVVSPFITATKIDPVMRTTFTRIEGWNIRYAYQLSNGSQAKQPIKHIGISSLPVNTKLANSVVIAGSDPTYPLEYFESAVLVPNSNWSGSGARTDEALNIDWLCKTWDASIKNYNTALGIQPGASLAGFGFISPDLPGVWVAQLLGNTRFHQFDFGGEGPDPYKTDIARQMGEIERNDFVARNIGAPLISVPSPFNAAELLDRIRTHVATWPGKQLLDPAFASQLDRYLVSAADAYRRNQLKAGKEHIETLREMLKREHKDLDHDDNEYENGNRAEKNDDHRAANQRILIDRLAARVLDFDLKYVLKRMGKDKD